MKISNKIITKTIVKNISLDEAWNLWTTHEGLKGFFGRDNKVNLEIGGEFEIYFLLDNEYGQRGSEGCKILSYLPKKMISFSWNVPPQFKKQRESDYKTWVVVSFAEPDAGKTEITLSNYGYPDDDEWNSIYEYFDKAWGAVMTDFYDL